MTVGICQICGSSARLFRCRMCGRYVCSLEFNEKEGICEICEMTLCRKCRVRLSIAVCDSCGVLVCEDCSIKVGVKYFCKDCYRIKSLKES